MPWRTGLVLLLSLSLLLMACRKEAPSTSLPGSAGYRSPASSPLPDFPITLYQGEQALGRKDLTFHDLLGTRPIVLNFWASNCPPCSAEMPEFERVWQEYKGQVLFFGLDVGRFIGLGGPEDSQRELRRLRITYPTAPAPDIHSVAALGLQALPSTYFITRKGKVHRKWVGILPGVQLRGLIEDLLKADAS